MVMSANTTANNDNIFGLVCFKALLIFVSFECSTIKSKISICYAIMAMLMEVVENKLP